MICAEAALVAGRTRPRCYTIQTSVFQKARNRPWPSAGRFRWYHGLLPPKVEDSTTFWRHSGAPSRGATHRLLVGREAACLAYSITRSKHVFQIAAASSCGLCTDITATFLPISRAAFWSHACPIRKRCAASFLLRPRPVKSNKHMLLSKVSDGRGVGVSESTASAHSSEGTHLPDYCCLSGVRSHH